MRKITFLWALLLCAGAAFAQVSELSELSNEKAYLLHNPNGFGYAYYNSSKSTSTLWLAEATAKSNNSLVDNSYTEPLDKTLVGAYFQVLTVDGKNYLYSLGAKKFVKTGNGPVQLIDFAVPITIEKTSNGFVLNSDPSYTQGFMCGSTHLSTPIQHWESTDAGSPWEFVEKDASINVADMPDMQEAIDKVRFRDVTYNYTVTDLDNLTFSRTVSQAVNSPYDPTTDFLKDYQFTAGTVSGTGDNMVNVSCQTNFPFEATTLPDGGDFGEDTHWYMLDVNNNANWFVYTSGDDVKVNGASTDAEAYYWCFVRKAGTYNEFSLYNMKTGAAQPLTIKWTTNWSKEQPYNQAPATMATGGNNTTTFRITANGTSNGFNIQMPETGINGVIPANIGHHNGDVFTVYHGANSSTVNESRVFVKNGFTGTAASRLAEHKAAQLPTFEATKDYVGGYPAEQVEALAACTTLADWTAHVSTPLIAIEEGKYYRIVSAAVQHGETVVRGENATIYPKRGTDGSYTSNWEVGTDAAKDAFSIWQFEAATNNSGQNGYKIKNVNLGKYFGSVAGGATAATMVEEAEATVYRTGFYEGVTAQSYFTHQTNATISTGSKATFIFCDSGKVDGWEGGANSNSAWYIVPATDLEVDLHTADNIDYYSTLYLPFGVTPQEGVTAYRATVNGMSLVLNAIEGGVPANTGVILKGTGAKCVLNISDEVPVLADPNQLEGACEIQEGITQTDFFVLGAANGKVGFYKPNATTLAANRAYLPASAVTTTTGLLSFAFGETTGIDAVETTAEPAAPVYYDLSGRRVLRPGKGIYVKNGRKVLIR